MTITDLRELPPLTEGEKLQELEQLRRIRQNVRLLESDPAELARIQGEGIAEHLQEFVRGNEDSFKAYFIIATPHHAQMHNAFLIAIQNRFPVVSRQQNDDPLLIQLEFVECGAGLLAQKNLDSDDNLIAVNYEGYITANQPPEMLGRIATGLAMS